MTDRSEPVLDQAPDRSRGLAAIASVDMSACILCAVCIGVCPEGAISIDDSVTVDRKLCSGCGTCIATCPTQALSFWHEALAQDGAR
jgi:ferredoxin